ncbi:MAG TPA: hypothetical protein VGK50_03665 [Coriobacteriia bacterium]
MQPYARALRKTAHAGISCYGCHLSSGAWDWPRFKTIELTRMYPLGLLGRDVGGPGVRTDSGRCLGCHRDVMTHAVERYHLRISHRDCLGTSGACDDCHTRDIHGSATRWVRQPVMEDCVLCHVARKAKTQCDACHTGKSQAERLAKGPWQVTHGANWRSTHGMGSIAACVECHPSDYCVRCHATPLPHPADFGQTHGKEATRPGEKCEGCHLRKSFCDACHDVPMPHPAGFLPDHVKTAKGYSDPQCLKCHGQRDCDACHTRHTHPGTSNGSLRPRSMLAPKSTGTTVPPDGGVPR